MVSDMTSMHSDVVSEPGRNPSRPARVARWARRIAVGVAMTVLALLALATLGPRVLPFQTFYVRSGSMRPGIPVGSLAVYTPIAGADLRPGDVIVFNRPGSAKGAHDLVTHRIVRIVDTAHGRAFVTKGDANPQPDPWRVPVEQHGWRYRFRIPDVGYVIGIAGSQLGHTWLLALAAIGLGLYLLIEIWRRPQPEVVIA